MSHVNSGDPRAHTDPREKERHARRLVEAARRLILEDQPSGVDACQECVGVTLMLALGFLADEIAKSGEYPDEMFGLAKRFGVFEKLCERLGGNLMAAGLSRGFLREMFEEPEFAHAA